MMGVRTIAVALALAVGLAAGWLANDRFGGSAGGESASADGPCPGGAKPLYWKAPMDPTYVRDKPGKSPMGMDLVPVCPGEEAGGGEGLVRIDPAVVQNIGVRTAPAERRTLARRVRTVGRVEVDERRIARVHPKIEGWVERLHVSFVGQAVERGAPLLEIYSPELVATQEELLLAARYRTETAESAFPEVAAGGTRLFEATRRRLELWDVPRWEIDRLLRTGRARRTLTLTAPVSGVVLHENVREEMKVGPGDALYTIADLSRVWVMADIYEMEAPWIHEGQRAVADLSYVPGATFEGRVEYVYPTLDAKTRTLRVRLEFDNPGLTLKPDMFANVTVEGAPRDDVLVVPDEAVLRSGVRTLVIVARGEGRFEPREVRTGIESGDGWIEVREGLAEGDVVVTSGQFLIDSESRLREAVAGMLSASGAEPSGAGAHEGNAMPDGSAPSPDTTGHTMPGMEGHAMPEGGHEGHTMPEGAHEGHAMPPSTPAPPAGAKE